MRVHLQQQPPEGPDPWMLLPALLSRHSTAYDISFLTPREAPHPAEPCTLDGCQRAAVPSERPGGYRRGKPDCTNNTIHSFQGSAILSTCPLAAPAAARCTQEHFEHFLLRKTHQTACKCSGCTLNKVFSSASSVEIKQFLFTVISFAFSQLCDGARV